MWFLEASRFVHPPLLCTCNAQPGMPFPLLGTEHLQLLSGHTVSSERPRHSLFSRAPPHGGLSGPFTPSGPHATLFHHLPRPPHSS